MPSGRVLLGAVILLVIPRVAGTQESFTAVAAQVNSKMAKLFGGGGFQGLASYGSGFLVSPDGYILTTASHLLLDENLRVHLADGRRFQAKLVVIEPALDAALLKIDHVEGLPFFDVAAMVQAPLARPGDWILAFSNEFQIATRDEPVSVQRGVIAAYAKLQGRRGVFEAPYSGDVYVIDAVTNNIGASGGVITLRNGQLLGVIGKELRNTLTNTWISYAVPIQALSSFVEKAKKGEYHPVARTKPAEGGGGYHGIVLVANVVDRTPPFIETVMPGSPAAKAGLKSDDLIVYIEGQQVVSVKAFHELVDKAKPGSRLKIEVRRADRMAAGGEKLVTAEVVLAEPPK
jgi:serine protease Do